MRRSRFTETKIVAFLAEADAGVIVTEVCCKQGSSGNTFYNRKKKYGGMGVREIKRMKELEAKNSRVKRMYSDLNFERDALKELMTKSFSAIRTPGICFVSGGEERIKCH